MTSPARDPNVWRPLPAQERALRSSAYELLYGGAAGGGKSAYLLAAPLRWVHLPAFRGLLLRRSFPELERTLIAAARGIYPRLGASYHEGRHEWTFPSGARIDFGYCERDSDVLRYQGAERAFIGFDELTHFTEAQYRYLTSRARSADGIPIRIRSTSNPGGPGHDWVRARWGAWLSRGAAPGSVRWYDPDGREVEWGTLDALSRTFVPARLADNPYLGAEYRAQLLALDPVTRAQLLEGDWDAVVGEGKLFHRDWWVYLASAPPVVRACRGWDLGAGGDPSEGVLLGDRGEGVVPRFVVLDVVTHQGPPHELHALVRQTAEADGPSVVVAMPQDPGQAGKDQAETYRRELAGFDVRTRPVSGDKVQRAGPWSSQVGARNVALVRGPWTPGYVAQHHAFPDGPHDDKVDASSEAFATLALGGQQVSRDAVRAAVSTLRGRESPFRPRF